MNKLFAALMLTVAIATAAQGQGDPWWTGPKDSRFSFGTIVRSANDRTAVVIDATSEKEVEYAEQLTALFPPHMFGTPKEYTPGRRGWSPEFGYYFIVDRGDVTIVVTETRAEELSHWRVTTYLLLRDLLTMWHEYTGYTEATMTLAYVPVFEEPVTFAIATMTEIGVRVIMAD